MLFLHRYYLQHRYFHYLHLHMKKKGTEMLSNLPKLTQLVREGWEFEPRQTAS